MVKKTLFILGQLRDRDLDWMLEIGKKVELPAGTELIHEGQYINAVYFVLQGVLGVYSAGYGDKPYARIGLGEIVGEMSFVSPRPPSATVRAIENSIVFSIPRMQLASKLAQDSAFAANWYQALAFFLADRLYAWIDRLALDQNEGHMLETSNEDVIVPNVLDTYTLAGSRFQRMLDRLLETEQSKG